MNRVGVPLICAGLVVAACMGAVRVPGATHRFPSPRSRPSLSVVLADVESPNPNYRYLAARYLGYYKSEPAFQALAGAARDPDFLVRLAALWGLMVQGDPRAIPILEDRIDNDRQEIVQHRAELYLDWLRFPGGSQTSGDALIEEYRPPIQ